MKVTKYEHACLVIENNGKKLVIDPGSLTSTFGDLDNIAGVVLTHVHFDHFNSEHIAAILAKNPSAQVFGTAQIAQAAPTLPITAVTGGTAESVGTFTLSFFGEKHAYVYDEQPQDQNVGVLVNNQLYYPGDSFTLPGVPVEILAVPSSGPWLKLSESLDFVRAIQPTRAFFPTHDGLLSAIGEKIIATWYEKMNEEVGGSYHPLKPGESIEA